MNRDPIWNEMDALYAETVSMLRLHPFEELFPIEQSWYEYTRDGRRSKGYYQVSGTARDLIVRHGLMSRKETEEFWIVKQLELNFDKLNDYQDWKRIEMLEKLTARIANLTAFEGLLLRLSGYFLHSFDLDYWLPEDHQYDVAPLFV